MQLPIWLTGKAADYPKATDNPKATDDPQTTVVPAGHGHAFEVKAGEHFRIVDLHGQQVVDFFAWVKPKTSSFKFSDLHEKLSMAYTRYHMSGATPSVSESLYTNLDDPIFTITADTVKTHDMTFMACFPELYEKKGMKGHRSCASNCAEAMEKYGMESYLQVTDPFNIFQNTPYYTLKPLNCSRAEDYIEFRAEKDVICAVSCCPYEIDGFNGGKITDIAVVTGIKS